MLCEEFGGLLKKKKIRMHFNLRQLHADFENLWAATVLIQFQKKKFHLLLSPIPNWKNLTEIFDETTFYLLVIMGMKMMEWLESAQKWSESFFTSLITFLGKIQWPVQLSI